MQRPIKILTSVFSDGIRGVDTKIHVEKQTCRNIQENTEKEKP